jgi:dTDP-4-dehydrorhamnose 3,5-epimerase-like enzyme
MQIKTIALQDYSDARGSLVALEDQKDVPFTIRRIYYIFGTKPDEQRGFHAHKDLTQLVVAVKGSCTFILDDGAERAEITLDNPARGLLVESMMWREMRNFSPDCVLMVLASAHYDESDYIRDYELFLKARSKDDSYAQ